MTIVVQGRVVLYRLVVQGDQVLGCPVSDFAFHSLLELLDSPFNRTYVHLLNCVLGHLRLHDQTLLLKLFLNGDTLASQTFLNHLDAIVAVLIHEHVEDPRLTVLHTSPVHCDLIVRCQAVINLLQSGQVSPRLQLCHVFNLRVRLQHHQVIFCHNKIDIDHLLANLASLLAFLNDLEVDLLLAGEDATISIAKPDQHVVVEVQVETP